LLQLGGSRQKNAVCELSATFGRDASAAVACAGVIHLPWRVDAPAPLVNL
jgi:hypothetical protein